MPLLPRVAKKTTVVAPKEFYIKPVIKEEFSVINLTVDFPTLNVQALMNSKIPQLLYEDTNIDDDNYILKVTKRDVFTIEPAGEFIYITAPIKIDAKARLNVGFFRAEQSGSFDLNVKFKTQIGVSPDWKLATRTEAAGFQWISDPRVRIGLVEVSVAPFLESMLTEQQVRLASQIDTMATRYVDLKALVANVWKYIQYPILIDKNVNAWAKIEPAEVYFIPIRGNKEKIKLGLGVKARLETVIGTKPDFDNTTIPQINTGTANDSLFSINLVTRIGFPEATALVKEQLKNQNFLENEKNKIKVEDIEFYGSGQRLVVKTVLSGDYNGVLYLSGIPYFDSTTATVRIKELDFDIETQNMLKQSYAWLMKGALKKKLTQSLQLPVATQAKNTALLLSNYFNALKIGEGIRMKCIIDDVSPKEIFIDENQLVVAIKASGKVTMEVEADKLK